MEEESPRDAKVIAHILESLGVQEYDPRVIHQLLEFMYRYMSDVFNDASMYAAHAGKDKIIIDDVKMAIKTQLNYSFTQPLPREAMQEVIVARNSEAIPLIPTRPGVMLPPPELCLTNPNYQIEVKKDIPTTRVESKEMAVTAPQNRKISGALMEISISNNNNN